MKRWLVPFAVVVASLSAFPALPAAAKTIGITATPNPARVADRVRHDIEVGTVGRLDVWVSARGFERPGSGTLPAGTWSYACCPTQTAGTPAWHFRSSSFVGQGYYRFGAVARVPGTFLSTAMVAGMSAGVWISIR